MRTVEAKFPLCHVQGREHLQEHLPEVPRVRKLAVFQHLQRKSNDDESRNAMPLVQA